MPFSDEERNKILEALRQKRTRQECPACGQREWVLGDHYTPLALHDMSAAIVVGGPQIPTVAVVCKNCGYVSLHSTLVLADLPRKPERKEPPNE